MNNAAEQHAVNVIRGLAMDAPHAANSGHQGTAMALAPVAHVLYGRIMRYDAAMPDWPDRDRFVLSCGHASVLLYSMLHLTGHGLERSDLENFRQLGSATPGHPEVGHTAGVEVTTGPLGQGVGNSVGMAIAERNLRARFGSELFDHRTFVVCSDGDLAEGLSHEAASLAGHLGLGRLTWIYDDNRISIDGETDLALSDDAPARFRAYGWHVVELGMVGDDFDAIEAGIREAMAVEDKPSLVVLRTEVGYPSPDHTGDPEAHGYVFKDAEITATKAVMGLPDEPFHIPDDVLALYRSAGSRGASDREAWERRMSDYAGDRATLDACLSQRGLPGWEDALPTFDAGESIATRKASQACVTAMADLVPGLIGGSADLTGNTGTLIAGDDVHTAANPGGRQIYFGIREHAMNAIMNGIALHGGGLPVGGTFLVFSDYGRPAVRLAALSDAKVVFVWTHDSIGVGEDGPTHQPVEQVAALRSIPNLAVVRPADANEVSHAWRAVVNGAGPTAFVLSRQNLPVLEATAEAGDGVARGAYVVSDPAEFPSLVLAASGSEVSLCMAAADLLAAEGVAVRVVSMPCWEYFDEQPKAYREGVIPPAVPSLGVEAGVALGWHRYVDEVVAMDSFGASGPASSVFAHFGFTPENVASRARALLASD